MASDNAQRSAGRDGFLDVVRAIALVRVVVWHALGTAATTYVVAAMPAMFFVTGQLWAGSARRHGVLPTLRDRLRRILPPLWAFAAVAWVAMAVAAHVTGTDLDWRNLPLWLLPVLDPSGSPWEGGWLSSPLWYLRALLWLLVLAPVLVGAARRWPRAAAVAGVATILVLDQVDRRPGWHPAAIPWLPWRLGDLALYGCFFAAGALAADGAFARVRPRRAVVVAGLAALGAAVWRLTQPVPLGVVNNSHPMHLLVGTAWLALAFAARPHLTRLATTAPTAGVVRFLGQRSLTIYLWHSAVISVALEVLAQGRALPAPVHVLAAAGLIAGGTTLVAVAAGWVEDLAARRPARWWPLERRPREAATGRRPVVRPALLAAVVGVAVLAVPFVGAGEQPASVRRPPIPSQAPPRPTFEAAEPATVILPDRPATIDPAALDALLDQWADEHGWDGAVAGVAEPGGGSWSGATGIGDDGTPRSGDDAMDLMSITKLFTANLVFRAVDAGLLDLDAPIPPLEAVPSFPYAGELTTRDLLRHRSGLVNYRETDRYQTDPALIASPADAIDAVGEAPLLDPPGTTPRYSSSNYLVLGYVLEQVTGRPFDDLLTQELLAPLGLAATTHLPPDEGEPRFATAGLAAPVDDLLTAGLGLLRDHTGISDESYAAMTSIDPDDAMGPGAMGYCPCTVDGDGSRRFFAVGHAGGSVWLGYLPQHDLVVTIGVTGGIWDDGRIDHVLALAQAIGDEVRGEHPA